MKAHEEINYDSSEESDMTLCKESWGLCNGVWEWWSMLKTWNLLEFDIFESLKSCSALIAILTVVHVSLKIK